MTTTLSKLWESYRFNEEAFLRQIYLLSHYNHKYHEAFGMFLVRLQVKGPNYVLAMIFNQLFYSLVYICVI